MVKNVNITQNYLQQRYLRFFLKIFMYSNFALLFMLMSQEVWAQCYNTNLALYQPVTVSSIENNDPSIYDQAHAVDGDEGTRWSSNYTDSEWLYVDLGTDYEICKVIIKWEDAYGEDYDLIYWDGSTWVVITAVTGNSSTYNEHNNLNVTTQFIGFQGHKRATTYGYSIWEFEVYEKNNNPEYPDYVPSNMTGPSTASAGSDVVMDLNIANNSNVAGNGGNGKDRYYFGENPGLWGYYEEIKNFDTGDLGPWASFDVNSGPLTIPHGASPGDYYIIFYMDADDYVMESDENNNVVYHPIYIGGEPDYVPIDFKLNGQTSVTTTSGATLSGSLYAKNQGSGAGTVNATGKYYFSYDSNLDGGDQELGSDDIEPLSPGQQTPENEDITLPGGLGVGTYYVFYKVDTDNVIHESNEDNNTAYVTINIQGNPPNAAFTASKTTLCLTNGQTETVTFTDQSSGNPTSYSWNFGGNVIYQNGTNSSSSNPQVKFTTAGTYTVSLTVSNAYGSDTETKNSYITVQTCVQPPVADFTATKTTLCPGETTQFSSLSTNNPTSYSWSFSGGSPSTSTSPSPSVTYNTPGTYAVSLTVSNAGGSDTETKNAYITVQQSCGPTNWPVTMTNVYHTVLVEVGAPVTINGVPVSVGDYIGAFYSDGSGLKCAGKAAWTGGDIAITVYGDDNATGIKDGFAVNEVFKWKIWKASSNEEYTGSATYRAINPPITHSEYFAANGVSGLASLNGTQEQTQTIPLNPGWNMISSYIQPSDPDIANVFAPIQSSIALVKNGMGNIYFPSSAINTIGNWNALHGYQVRVIGNSPVNLQLTGQKKDAASNPLSLVAGWNLFAYLRESAQAIETALAPILSEVIIVKNGAGQIYFPSASINNIGMMMPGEGYQARLASDVTLTYTARMVTPPANMHRATLEPTKYRHDQISSTNASLILNANEILEYGDEVGVFDANGTLAGAAVYEGYTLAFSIWGDDPATTNVEGLQEGASFEVKVWRKGTQREEVMSLVLDQGENIFTTNGIMIGSLERTINLSNNWLAENSLNLYPNPSKTQTTLSLELVKSAQVKVDLYDLSGKLIQAVSNEQMLIGKNEVNIMTSHLSDGLYHCSISVGDFVYNIPLSIIK